VNYLQRENLRLFLAWQEKWRRCYVEADPWPPAARTLFDRHLERKRQFARLWLATKSARWRKPTHQEPIARPKPPGPLPCASARALMRWRQR
jgi:hypothetical protein